MIFHSIRKSAENLPCHSLKLVKFVNDTRFLQVFELIDFSFDFRLFIYLFFLFVLIYSRTRHKMPGALGGGKKRRPKKGGGKKRKSKSRSRKSRSRSRK